MANKAVDEHDKLVTLCALIEALEASRRHNQKQESFINGYGDTQYRWVDARDGYVLLPEGAWDSLVMAVRDE